MGKGQELRSIVESLVNVQEQAFTPLREGARTASLLFDRVQIDGRVMADELNALQPEIFRRLENIPAFYGTGFVADPSALADAKLYEEWWLRSEDGVPRRLSVNREYDYTTMPYFAGASRGAEVIVGPYLDFTGADKFVFTLAVPVVAGDRFIGVYGADVIVPTMERTLMPILRAFVGELVLFGDDRRVVASTSADYGPGDRIALNADEVGASSAVGTHWQVAQIRR
ncbi:cache domain-containing protein [Leucobacter sp. Z1108]|uniref:cache domain-containing protein n=1 Tax=Leucobacter sp. Z1108 TaxID=3439066 RepID=UPI003F3BBA28